MSIYINSRAQYGMGSWELNAAGIPNIHEDLAVWYFTSKHTIFGIPEAIKSLQASKLSTARFFRRTRAVHLLPRYCYRSNQHPGTCSLYIRPSHSGSMDDGCALRDSAYLPNITHTNATCLKKINKCTAGGGPGF